MRVRIIGTLCFVLMASLATDAKANFVVDGNFSTPTVTGNWNTYFLGSTAMTGWTVISGMYNSGAGSVDLLSPTNFIAPDPSAPAGSQTVDLDGTYGNPAGGLMQTITGLTAGQTYNLSFFYTNNPDASNSSAQVTIDGLNATITHSGSSHSTPNYTFVSYSFVATGTDILKFVSTDPASDAEGIVLDNVSIVPAGVPEPASFAMLGLGLLAVGGFVRARRRLA